MNLTIELLASAHEADVEREASARRLRSALRTCRRRLLGILPIRQACNPQAAC